MFWKMCVIGILAAMIGGVGFSGENRLSSPAFSKEHGWLVWMSDKMTSAGAKAEYKDGKAIVSVPGQDKPKFSEMQLIRPLDLAADTAYVLKLRVASDKPGTIVIGYGMRAGARTSYGAAKIRVAPGDTVYEATLQVSKAADGSFESPRVLRIHLGEVPGAALTLSDITLEEK